MSALFPIRNFGGRQSDSGIAQADRVVVGAWEDKDFAVMRGVYQRFDAPDVESILNQSARAAAGKLLANFLFIQ